MDKPCDSVLDDCQLLDDDIVIIGTDGLWDNMFDEEIIEIVQRHFSNLGPDAKKNVAAMEQEMKKLSETLVTEGKAAACDCRRVTPFSKNSQKHGLLHYGG
jgi:serine/threonine protein phosphatase PrpC